MTETKLTDEDLRNMVKRALAKGGYPTYAHMMDEYYKNDYSPQGRWCWHKIQGMEDFAGSPRYILQSTILDSFYITGRGRVYMVAAPTPPYYINETVLMGSSDHIGGELYKIAGIERRMISAQKGVNPYVMSTNGRDVQALLLSSIPAVEADFIKTDPDVARPLLPHEQKVADSTKLTFKLYSGTELDYLWDVRD